MSGYNFFLGSYLFVSGDGFAGADKVAVAVGVVNAADWRPEFVVFEPGSGICSSLARVWVQPIVRGYVECGVR